MILRRQPSQYDLNAVDLLIPSRNGPAKFMGHLDREAAPLMTHLLSDGMDVTA